jgi:hypothetical protein
MRRKIHICSDSRAALAALAKITTGSSLVWDCMQVPGKLSELNKANLVWIQRHQAVPCNEEAFGTGASGQVDCLCWLPTVQMLMRYRLPEWANEQLALSRWGLRAAVGLLQAIQPWELICINLKNAGCVDCLVLGQHVFKVQRSCKSDGRQPIKPNGQHRAWHSHLTS